MLPLDVARRYLVLRSGLLPLRRVAGKDGTAAALQLLGQLQVDPVTILAKSHDITLWNRVEGYRREYLEELLYKDRRFFEYGGHLDIYPIATLPLWRLHMRRRATDPRQAAVSQRYGDLIPGVLARIRDEGPLTARDFGGQRVASYRARHDAGLVLYHLWLTGHLMTHSRQRGERVYDLFERVVPDMYRHELPERETEEAMACLTAARADMLSHQAWRQAFSYAIFRKVPEGEALSRLRELEDLGLVRRIGIEGVRGERIVSAAGLETLDALVRGEQPAGEGFGPEEALFLSPLDNVLDRRHLKDIFHFDYAWEIYKRSEDVRYGRYVTPILLGDRLVGRMSPRLDAGSGTLIVQGIWAEDPAFLGSVRFQAAVARGLRRLMAFVGAERLDLSALAEGALRQALAETQRDLA